MRVSVIGARHQSILRHVRSAIIITLALAAGLVQATPVARLNGAPIHDLTLDLLHQAARHKQPGLSRADVLEQVVANRLLAATTQTRFREYDLSVNRRVAFAADVATENHLVALLAPLYEAKNGALGKGRLQDRMAAENWPDAKAWDAIFGTPGRLMLDYSLSRDQQVLAQSLILFTSRVPGAERVSLYEVFRRLNVQGRVEFFNRNFAFVQQQAHQYLASKIVLDWAGQHYGQSAVADLRAALDEREQARAVLALHGIGADIDADSDLLVQLLDQVSPAEIKAYYLANLDQFKRINKVKARHIRLPDETSAQQVVAQLAKGADFAQLAREKSIAADAKSGGDLGWMVHQPKMDWLAGLAFTQQAGQSSPPFRAPVGPNEAAYYEIVKVEQREDGYQALDSESVRYGARRALARQKAVQQLTQLQQQLRQQAKLEWLDVRYRQAGSGAGASVGTSVAARAEVVASAAPAGAVKPAAAVRSGTTATTVTIGTTATTATTGARP